MPKGKRKPVSKRLIFVRVWCKDENTPKLWHWTRKNPGSKPGQFQKTRDIEMVCGATITTRWYLRTEMESLNSPEPSNGLAGLCPQCWQTLPTRRQLV